MKTASNFRFCLVALLGLSALSAFSQDSAPPIPHASEFTEGSASAAQALHHYILILKPGRTADPDITSAGGKVVDKQYDWIMVTMSDAAAETLRKDARIKYLQRTVLPGELTPTPVERASVHQAVATEGVSPLVPRTSGTGRWSTGMHVYDGAGNISAIGTAQAPNSDNRSNSFAYDVLGRLTQGSANFAAGNYSQSYEYDGFGNLTKITTTDPTGVYPNPVVIDGATNRLSTATAGISYDEAGNLTSDSVSSMRRFDSLNMMTEKLSGGEEFYVYTAADERVGTKTADSWWIWTFRDVDGKVLRQYKSLSSRLSSDWLWLEDYAYFDGKLLAAERAPEEGGRRHFHLDHLDSVRLVTGANGGLIARHDYLPFGREVTPVNQELMAGFDRIDPIQFTQQERDFAGTSNSSTDYLDYMHARYFEPTLGRFLSVDPVPGTPANPQTWNRYAYVLNNPINLNDPTGRIENGKPCNSNGTGTPCAPPQQAQDASSFNDGTTMRAAEMDDVIFNGDFLETYVDLNASVEASQSRTMFGVTETDKLSVEVDFIGSWFNLQCEHTGGTAIGPVSASIGATGQIMPERIAGREVFPLHARKLDEPDPNLAGGQVKGPGFSLGHLPTPHDMSGGVAHHTFEAAVNNVKYGLTIGMKDRFWKDAAAAGQKYIVDPINRSMDALGANVMRAVDGFQMAFTCPVCLAH